jgi:hypothetical protein
MMTTGASLPVINQETIAPFIQAYRAQTGRPTDYNEMIAAEIIERTGNGELLTHICREPHLPSFTTLCDWRRRRPEFAQLIADARTDQATVLASNAVQILDDAPTESMPQVQKADKQAQIRMKLAACYDRETYGDKVQQDINVKGVVIHTEAGRLSNLLDGD